MSGEGRTPCGECGAANRARALYCLACGAKLRRPPPPVTETRVDARRLRGWMACFDFDQTGETFLLREGQNVLGAEPREATVLLAASRGQVVARHGAIRLEADGGAWASPLDGAMTLNGAAVPSAGSALHDGDQLRVGAYTLIVKLLP
ncbi:zinc ribbon domain-containing protein [Myxococcota bacterium]|nr:zinc ribbon domain-containing protein [Myxococcota bacterium]